MSYLNFDDGAAWSAPIETSSGDIVRDAMKKEQIIQCVEGLQPHSQRSILSSLLCQEHHSGSR